MNPCTRYFLLASLLVIAAVSWLVLSSDQADAQQPIGQQWSVNQQIPIDEISHAVYHDLLQKYVDENGMVDYAAWRASSQDRGALQNYLKQLSRADVTRQTSRSKQLAYWINAYNAVTVEGILQVYPTTSIRKHTAKVVGYNIWQDLKLPTGNGKEGGTAWSLEQIEHEVLRKLGEPRIHFAIVCASVGCPRLLNEAYTGNNLEQQLQKNTLDFFSRPQNLFVDQRKGQLKLSAILKWFGSDFGKTAEGQVAAIAPYFPESAKALVASGRYRISYLSYNWDLNVQK